MKQILNKKDRQFVKKHFEEEKYLFSYCTDYLALSHIEELYKKENLCYESTLPLTTGIVLETVMDENDSFCLTVLAAGKVHLVEACPTTEENISRVISRVNENPEEWLPDEGDNVDCLRIFQAKPFLLEIDSGVITLVRPLNASLAEDAVKVMKRMIANGYLEFTDPDGQEIA